MSIVPKLLIFSGPILLAALAFWAAGQALIGRKRLLYRLAFVAIGFATVAASVYDSVGTDQRLTQVWEYQTGGNHYPIIRAYEPDLRSRAEKIRFEIGASGPLQRVAFHIHPAATKGDASNSDYYKYSAQGGTGMWTPIGSEGTLLKGAFPIGSYRIEMDAPNGHFVEFLNIFDFNGQLVQTVDVTKAGKKLFSSQRP